MSANDVQHDQLALIRIEGMHCHKCEQTIQRALTALPGVREVEVDFNSRQASVLYDPSAVTVNELVHAVNASGYHAVGFTQRKPDSAPHH